MLERILVASMDIKTRERFYEVLSSLGYQVSCVPSGEEALLRLTEERYELIILDEDMPNLSCLDTAKKIREFDKETKIIILSKEEKLLGGLEVQGVVKKDFSSHLMLKKILELLKERSLSPQKEALKEKKEKILVVDDSQQIRDLLWTFLDKKGYKVISASSGEDALIKVKAERPRVVFLDIRMPGMDGLLVLKKIKEIDPKIKVVMLTSAQESYIIEEAKNLGADDYLTKPCDFKELEAVLLAIFVSDSR